MLKQTIVSQYEKVFYLDPASILIEVPVGTSGDLCTQSDLRTRYQNIDHFFDLNYTLAGFRDAELNLEKNGSVWPSITS